MRPLTPSFRSLFAVIPLLCASTWLRSEPAPSEIENSGKSIWTQNISGIRKEHGAIGGYTKKWDLSDLPHYVPKQQLTGTIRIWGNNYLKDGQLGEYWVEAFKKFQPGLTIEYHLPTGTIAVSAVAAGIADLGMNYKATLSDRLIFEQVFHHPLTEITAVTGSYDVYGWGPAGIVVVNKDNPLTQISVKQLDGVFGSARLGGYAGSVWHTEYPYSRGPEENIRTWGQLGLTGEWADRPIQTYGYAPTGMRHFFELRVFQGGDKWAPNYRESVETGTKMLTDGSGVGSHDMLLALAHDKFGIGWSGNGHAASVPGLKAIALASTDGGPYYEPNERNMQTHDYPLSRNVFIYVNRVPGRPLDPKLKEFLRFILSAEGQDLLTHHGLHLPLTATNLEAQRAKLE